MQNILHIPQNFTKGWLVLPSLLVCCVASQSSGLCLASRPTASFRKNSCLQFRFSRLAMRGNFFLDSRRYFWFLRCFRRENGRTAPPVFSGNSACPVLAPGRLLSPPPNLRAREKQSFSFPLWALLKSMPYSRCQDTNAARVRADIWSCSEGSPLGTRKIFFVQFLNL